MPFIACLTNTQQKLQRLRNTHSYHWTGRAMNCTSPATATRHVTNATDPGVDPSQDARVHYSDHKVQAHQPPTHPNGASGTKGTQEKPRNGPLRHRGGSGPDPSGPNSVPSPLPHHRGPQVPHPPASWRVVLRRPRPGEGSFIDDSTSEHHHCQPHGRWLRGVCAP